MISRIFSFWFFNSIQYRFHNTLFWQSSEAFFRKHVFLKLNFIPNLVYFIFLTGIFWDQLVCNFGQQHSLWNYSELKIYPEVSFLKDIFKTCCFRKFHYWFAHFPVDSDILQGVKKLLMGEDKKELVDPYAIFQFAGKEVKSSIKYNSDHPEWNEEMHIGLQVKSIALSVVLLSNQSSAFLFSFRRCVNA